MISGANKRREEYIVHWRPEYITVNLLPSILVAQIVFLKFDRNKKKIQPLNDCNAFATNPPSTVLYHGHLLHIIYIHCVYSRICVNKRKILQHNKLTSKSSISSSLL